MQLIEFYALYDFYGIILLEKNLSINWSNYLYRDRFDRLDRFEYIQNVHNNFNYTLWTNQHSNLLKSESDM